MDSILISVEERLRLFADMIESACGLSLWSFGMAKQLYSCTCVAEKEFRLFLEVGKCLDYAIAHAAESPTPIIMSDPIGMLWVAEYVQHSADTGYIILLGPIFDVATSPQTLNDHLRGMNLSVALTAAIAEKMDQVPVLNLPTLHQYIKMLHWIIHEQELDVDSIRLQSRRETILEEKSATPWDPDRARLLEAEILQRIRTGNIYDRGSTSNLQRFADKDFYGLGDPLRENKNTAIIFTALCARAAMDGGLAPRIAKQLEVQYVRAIEQCTDLGLLQVNGAMVEDFTRRVHECRTKPALSPAVQECCAYVQSHVADDIAIEDIADAVGYTAYYLTKKFRRETGQRLTDYINRARIRYACAQLVGTDKTLQKISEELHYSSRSYFTTVFRKVMGCTPITYRTEGGKTNELGC